MIDQRSLGKRAAARAVADSVKTGQRLGLGTGSTVTFFLERLAERVAEEGLRIVGVPTSEPTSIRARELGLPLGSLDAIESLDLAVDGADEVDPQLDLIKGGGAALTREKIVAAAAARFVVIVDETKLVARLGASFRLPIEVLPFGWRQSSARIAALGLRNELRREADSQPLRTDNGNYVLDAVLGPCEDLRALELELDAIPGVLECGLFVGMADEAWIGGADGSVRVIHRPSR